MKMAEVLQMGTKQSGEKEKLLVTSSFFFSHIVFKRLCKYQGLLEKGLGTELEIHSTPNQSILYVTQLEQR